MPKGIYYNWLEGSHNYVQSMKELYSVLELPRGSSEIDVKKAYRKLALKVNVFLNTCSGCSICIAIFSS
jgi:hypothetical protein